MLQILSIWARLCLVTLLACLCVFGLTGWAVTGAMRYALAWISWFFRTLWATPILRAVVLVAAALEVWNRVTFRRVWS